MLRKALFILALLLPVASRAAGETALPPDSLKTKVVRTARKVDHFLLKNQQKQTTNTDYIFKPQQKWLFRTRSDLVFNLNEFHYDHRGTLLDYGMDLKAKPLFRQHFGVGYRGVILGFGIAIPFKNKDKDGELLPDNLRLKPYGKFIRSASLDELPELLNILKGDMSIVGPRPLLVKYLPRYNKHQARRHEVRPGFTGLAQVSGRNAISWEEKFDLDVEYVDNITFLGDWKIIFRTIAVVLKHDGISSENCATMEEFMGCSDAHGAFESDS